MARAHVVDGTLIVEALEEGAATVTVTATDALGQAATLTFTVQATPQPLSRWRGWRSTLLSNPAADP